MRCDDRLKPPVPKCSLPLERPFCSPPFFCSLIFTQVLFGSFDGHGSSFLLHAQTPEIVPFTVKLSLARCFDEAVESFSVFIRP